MPLVVHNSVWTLLFLFLFFASPHIISGWRNQRIRDFLSFKASRRAQKTTQPHIQWESLLFPLGVSDREVKLTTHHLVRRSKASAAVPPLPLYFHGVHRDNFTFTLPMRATLPVDLTFDILILWILYNRMHYRPFVKPICGFIIISVLVIKNANCICRKWT